MTDVSIRLKKMKNVIILALLLYTILEALLLIQGHYLEGYSFATLTVTCAMLIAFLVMWVFFRLHSESWELYQNLFWVMVILLMGLSDLLAFWLASSLLFLFYGNFGLMLISLICTGFFVFLWVVFYTAFVPCAKEMLIETDRQRKIENLRG